MDEAIEQVDQPKAGRSPTTNLIIVLVGVVALFYVLNRPAPELTGWQGDYNQAMAEAASTGHNVLIAFHASTCPPCVAMERTVLGTDEVTRALEEYVPVRLQPFSNPALAQRLKIMATPTYAVLDPQGQLLGKIEGYLAPDEFIAFLQGTSTG
ncbi:MAG: thioredoxin family protein [Phycisphaerales bacterium]|nr:MAG: thioredoxin family protein [Phycisphaerales bacterium]